MLVLSRRRGDEVVIDGSICVRVLEVNGSVVKLGFTAPREVPIVRREICDRESFVANDATALALMAR
jgi:carbon storage regulator